MDYQFEAQRTAFCIPVPMEDFRLINESDSLRWDGPQLLESDFNHLTGVHTLDFSGHYGAAVYITIDTEGDNEDTRRGIIAVIKAAVEEMREYKLEEAA